MNRNARLPKTNPTNKSADIGMSFFDPSDCLRDLTCDESKISGIQRHINLSDLFDHPIVKGGRPFFKQTLSFSAGSDRINDIISFLAFGEKIRNDFWRIL